MWHLRSQVAWSLTAAAVLSLSACGGGGELESIQAAPEGVRTLVIGMHAQSASGPNRKALALSTVGAKELFDWAAYKFPTLFPSTYAEFPLDYLGTHYTVRAYPNGNYLGLTDDGRIFGLGPFTAGQLTPFGNVSDYADLVKADSCNTYPGTCGGGGTTVGALNGCVMSASEGLATGLQSHLVYATAQTGGTAAGSGETTIDMLVDGPATFEGQSAVRISTTVLTTFTVPGMAMTSTESKVKSYSKAGDNGLILTLGAETSNETQTAGTTATIHTKTVFSPAYSNTEFTLKAGESLTQTVNSASTATTVVGGFSLPPTTLSASATTVHTYQARETILVQGKSYDTCRYLQTLPATPNTSTQVWYLYGKGTMVKSVTSATPVTSTTELKSGTLNGSPL